MPILPIALSNKSNPARFQQGGSARLINCFVEQIGEEGKVPWAVYACDGLQGFAALGGSNGGIRAKIVVNNVLYCVAGTGFWSVTTSGVVTLLGSMNISTTAPVYIARNRRSVPDIAIVCDGLMFNYRAPTFAQVTDVDLLAPTSLGFVDGYFLISTANNTWQVGALDDGTAWDGLDVARADANPDAVVRVSALQRDAVIFGEVSTEFWRNTGAADFAFERVTAIDIGCLAPNSVETVDQTLAWVANDRTVRMLAGYEGRRISTHAVERAIEDLEDRANQISATSWVKDGHTFYKLTSPDWTWVYDTVTGNWHERQSYGQVNWKISTVTAFGDRLIAGSADEGLLYEMGPDFADEAGEPLVCEVTLPPVHAYPHRLTHNEFFLDCEKGVGLGQGAPQNVDPEVMLSWSDDGGATFTGQRLLKMGQQGKRVQTLRTARLGQSKRDGRVYRISCSAKVVRAFYQAMADVRKDAA